MLKPNDYKEFQNLLLNLRARLRGDVNQLTANALTGNNRGTSQNSNDMAELRTHAYEQESSIRFL